MYLQRYDDIINIDSTVVWSVNACSYLTTSAKKIESVDYRIITDSLNPCDRGHLCRLQLFHTQRTTIPIFDNNHEHWFSVFVSGSQ